MFGILNTQEIEQLLKEEVVGRIGCSDSQRIYIVPISYVYDGQYVYCHAKEGLKVQMMRKNPDICFEVDRLYNMANWESVIAKGTFEELKDNELRVDALHKLYERKLPVLVSETVHLSPDWPFASENVDKITGVTFRIRLEEKTGRFERAGATAEAAYFF